ncbi:MAG: TetR/AcrR family transcriptional regulator [Candidatus Cloacimonetes bacterium]|nr:TetR/AcrR family transcriptional regulator [Candidatus Cloacimonadota bacterium]
MDEKKVRIITAAKELIATYGFKKTTMDEIAVKARMGKSTLYYYFKNKEDIFAEIVGIDSDLFRNKLSDSIANAATPKDKIMQYVRTRMLHLKELSNFYKTLTNEYLDHYFFIEQVREDFYNFENNILSDLINQGIRQKIFTPCEVDVVVRMIAIAIKGLEYPLFIQKEQDLEMDSQQMMEIIFKGIEVRN